MWGRGKQNYSTLLSVTVGTDVYMYVYYIYILYKLIIYFVLFSNLIDALPHIQKIYKFAYKKCFSNTCSNYL